MRPAVTREELKDKIKSEQDELDEMVWQHEEDHKPSMAEREALSYQHGFINGLKWALEQLTKEEIR